MNDDGEVQATVEDISFEIDEHKNERKALAVKNWGDSADGERTTQIIERLRDMSNDALGVEPDPKKLRADGYTEVTAHTIEEARRLAEIKGLNPNKVRKSWGSTYWLPPFEH